MTDRAQFAPENFRAQALADPELGVPIQEGVTLPGESVTKLMTDLLDVKPGDRVLVIGTGTGYQTLYVAEHTGAYVDSIDIRLVMPQNLIDLMPDTVRLYRMDGFMETPQDEMYEAVLVTFSSPHIMLTWCECLVEGGRLVAPIGNQETQALRKYIKKGKGMDDVGDFAYLRFVNGDVLVEGKPWSIFTVVMNGLRFFRGDE